LFYQIVDTQVYKPKLLHKPVWGQATGRLLQAGSPPSPAYQRGTGVAPRREL